MYTFGNVNSVHTTLQQAIQGAYCVAPQRCVTARVWLDDTMDDERPSGPWKQQQFINANLQHHCTQHWIQRSVLLFIKRVFSEASKLVHFRTMDLINNTLFSFRLIWEKWPVQTERIILLAFMFLATYIPAILYKMARIYLWVTLLMFVPCCIFFSAFCPLSHHVETFL